MFTYLRTHLRHLLLVSLMAAMAACTTVSPEVKVIAMSQAQSTSRSAPQVLVFMEVVNPTSRDLSLSRLDYRLSADAWFESNGTVGLSRRVAAKSSTVVEIAVPISELQGKSAVGVPYRLKGRLFARADRVERSWSVDAEGNLETRAASFRIRGTGDRVGASDE